MASINVDIFREKGVKSFSAKVWEPLNLMEKHNRLFCSTLSEFENFLLCEQILINVTTCQNETSN
jgi:hypothetical protein